MPDNRLTRGMSPDEKERFLEAAIHNSFIVDHLRTAIARIYGEKRKAFKKDDYNIANWAYLAADQNGEARAFEEILALLDSLKPKGHDK